MLMDPGFVALAGLCCFLWPFLYFAVFRTVNRPINFLLSVSFFSSTFLFLCVAGLAAMGAYLLGIACMRRRRRACPIGPRRVIVAPIGQPHGGGRA